MNNSLVGIMFLLSGCATAIPLNGNEICAQDGMTLIGTTHNSERAVVFNSQGSSATGYAYSNGTQCLLPKNPDESKEINFWQREVVPKNEYNQNINVKRLLTGLGWCWIVPGILFKLYYDSQYDSAVQASNSVQRAN